ncbi:MAG: protein-disulfide reductase DsbD [Phenylobacterium sp.]|uniref:protein-disulfide reductase DsbD n=1 Tax=Phenylobacterium sp. TaxID=1871053 RepID=UPI00272318BD|nr:protein-disulfide reductase DsbD [Phenylobacterium sp.]MDO8411042.1 protein-disulfide reductase DsbD [Phenylobacterium sp.]
MQRLLLLLALLSTFLAPAAWAAPSLDDRFQLKTQTLADGSVRLDWTIGKGAYLYRDHVAVTSGAPPRVLAVSRSKGEIKEDPGFGTVEIWRGQGQATVMADVLRAAGSPRELTVTYQGCEEDSICYPPVTKTVSVQPAADIRTGSSPWPFDAPVAAPASAQPEASAAPAAAVAVPQIEVTADTGLVSRLAARGGTALVLLAFAGFGLLLAFTPCVFPMYPILAGILARDGEQLSPRRGLSLSLAYVLAMASAFALLGLVAAWSGANLQMVLQSPYAIGLLSGAFVIFALSMFGAFELQLPQSWVARLSRNQPGQARPSLASSAALGFTSALIVGPCVTAPLAGALIYIAQTGDLALGAGALFALGLGKGIPLIAMGVLGPRALPRAGPWMERVKQLFGVMFLATALWLASRVLPPSVTLAMGGVLLIGLAVALGVFERQAEGAGVVARAAKAAALVVGLWGSLLLIGAASGAESPLKPLEALAASPAAPSESSDAVAFVTARGLPALEREVAEAVSAGQPSLVYFTADWCLSCDVIERRVFDDPGVRAELAGVRLIKADVTANDAAAQAMLRRFAAAGPPTMVFLDRRAAEAGGARQVGELSARDFLGSLAAVQETRS